MIRKRNIITVTCLIILIIGCSNQRNLKNVVNRKSIDKDSSEYYNVFTEATKHALFGNYRNAINLYNLCVRNYSNQAAPYYQLSSIYMKLKDFELSKYYGRKAEKLDNDNIWYKLHLANLYQFEQKYDSASFLYEEIIEIKDDPEYLYNLVLLYSQTKNDEKALRIIGKLENEYSESKELYIMKHDIYNNLKKYDSAVYQLEKLISLFPYETNNYGLLAEYLSEIGRNKYADSIYKRVLKNDSTNGLVLLSYGDFYLNKNKPDSAFSLYSKAMCCSDLNIESKINAIAPFLQNEVMFMRYKDNIKSLLKDIDESKPSYQKLALISDIYIKEKKFDSAKVVMDSILEIKRDNEMLWEQSLFIDNYLGDNEDIVSKTDYAVEKFSDNINFWLLRAYAAKATEKYDIAEASTDSGLVKTEEEEKIVQFYNIKAELYRIKESNEKSDEYFEKALSIDPDNSMILNNYSYYLSLRGEKLDMAAEMSEKSLELEPGNPIFLDTYAWILFKKKDYKEAKKYIEKAVRNGAHDNTEVLEHYGEIMLKLGMCKEAIEAWEQAIAIDSKYPLKEKIMKAKSNCQ